MTVLICLLFGDRGKGLFTVNVATDFGNGNAIMTGYVIMDGLMYAESVLICLVHLDQMCVWSHDYRTVVGHNNSLFDPDEMNSSTVWRPLIMANGTIAFDTLQTSGQIDGTARSIDTDYLLNGSGKTIGSITIVALLYEIVLTLVP